MPKGQPRIEKHLQVQNGGRPNLFTEDDIPRMIQAIEEGEGHKGRTASLLGITTATLNKYINKFPVLQEHFEDAKYERAEEVLDIMMDRIREGANGSHIREIYILNTLGGLAPKTIHETHSFNWREELRKVEEEQPEIIEGNFVNDESGW